MPRSYVHMLIATVFPWLAVWLAKGTKKQKWTTFLLEFAGHIPAVVYAIWVIVTTEQATPQSAVSHERLAA